MKRRRGRPARQYNLRVRSVRRNPIDVDALARAALEQAAMDQQLTETQTSERGASRNQPRPNGKDRCHDALE